MAIINLFGEALIFFVVLHIFFKGGGGGVVVQELLKFTHYYQSPYRNLFFLNLLVL